MMRGQGTITLIAALIAAMTGAFVLACNAEQAEQAGADEPAPVVADSGAEVTPEPTAPPPPVTDAARDEEPVSAAPSTDTPSVPDASAGYPDDAPYYPNSHPLESGRSADGRFKQISASPDSGEQVYAHMMLSLEAQGWRIETKIAQNGQFAIDATKGERRAAVLIADREVAATDDRTTRITVIVAP